MEKSIEKSAIQFSRIAFLMSRRSLLGTRSILQTIKLRVAPSFALESPEKIRKNQQSWKVPLAITNTSVFLEFFETLSWELSILFYPLFLYSLTELRDATIFNRST